jgi:hypothetical protein
MSKYIATPEDLNKYKLKILNELIRFSSTFGSGKAIELCFDLNGKHYVRSQREIILETLDAQLACDKFNELNT